MTIHPRHTSFSSDVYRITLKFLLSLFNSDFLDI
ncbi:hypothetical protein CNECB9_2260029 [Cupriavidus necator]|uniref:Uncharacterized protein n=1 Tax=Cupriavidus necator TaxID=106590 RepID=A0A1K0IQL0_CUPNE|nr:hypothetical protein CNECB9_2260029 [Cupriavidus necator]